MTGMSGSGKSTLASYLAQRLRAIGRKVELLDGDEIKDVLSKDLGFTKEERNTAVRRIGYVAKLLSRNGVVALAAAVSPYRDARDQVRREINRFVEVFVDCPVEKLIERDTKGLYKKALAGELPNFTGITDPYEPPSQPEVVVRTDRETVEASAGKIVQACVDAGCLSSDEAKRVVLKPPRRPDAIAAGPRPPARAAPKSHAKKAEGKRR